MMETAEGKIFSGKLAPHDFLYRYEDHRYNESSWDDYLDKFIPHIRLRMDSYLILKTTPCGVWISLFGGSKRFVLLTARKKWACKTKEEALESFIRRKKRQIGILECQLAEAQEALRLAEALVKQKEKENGQSTALLPRSTTSVHDEQADQSQPGEEDRDRAG